MSRPTHTLRGDRARSPTTRTRLAPAPTRRRTRLDPGLGPGSRQIRCVGASVREDVDELAALALAELHPAVDRGEEGVVAAATHVLTGVELGAPLADEDRAGGHLVAVEHLHAEALCVGVAAVPG